MVNKRSVGPARLLNYFRITEFNISYYFMLFIIIGASIISKGIFINPDNLLELLNRASILGMIAIGEGLVIMTAGIDLSVGAIVGLSVACMTVFLRMGINPWIIITISTAAASLCGLVNGFIVGRTKIPPFAITLGTSLAIQSIALYIVGAGAEDMPQIVQMIRGSAVFGHIQRFFPAMVWLLGFVVIGTLFYFTKFGISILAIGGNEKASKYSGIKIKNIKLFAYLISGICCGISAFLLIYKIGGANPLAGAPYLLESIMAVVIGGIVLDGGKGNIFNVFVGSFTMVSLTNLMNLLRVDPFLQDAFKGILLLFFIFIMGAALRYSESRKRLT